MPRGYTQATFHDADGEVVDVVELPTNRVFPILGIPSSHALTLNLAENCVQMVKAHKPTSWFAYRTETYSKREPSAVPGVNYDFMEDRIVARCAAMTKQGKHCKNEAEKGSMFCHSAHRPEKGVFPLVEHEFLLQEFRQIASLGPLHSFYENLKK